MHLNRLCLLGVPQSTQAWLNFQLQHVTCYVLRLSLVQDKPEATTVNCCFKYKYKADVPALPEIIRRQQCNACNAAKAVKLPSRIMQGRSCKATCSLGDGLVVGGKSRHGRLASRNFIDLGMQASLWPRSQANRRGKNKDEPFLPALATRPNDP